MRNPPTAALALLIYALGASAPTLGASEDAEQPGHEAELLDNTRQLIFEGRRSGEGYFSADGSRMVFQSERQADNPFYQIFIMDLETGDTRRLSTGIGKTTCAWIHPRGDRVLFASTHEDPDAERKQSEELEKRASGTASRYSWSFDDQYQIYEADLEGRILRRLTDAPGYDAEGSWSPDGGQIVFASNRHAYRAGALTEQEREVFEKDPSVYMDLYIMDADGSNVRRLTESLGYDGGPFFNADGSRIVWRRFAPKGHVAEIWTMNPDGSDHRQITRLGVMSWAPFFHPSGDYIVFANNAHGYGNFELYIVDSLGARPPVRVTESPGFDGLPVFSPDGKRLSWASSRTPDKQAQIFIADWDHAAARRLLGLRSAGADGASRQEEVPRPAAQLTRPEITQSDLRLRVAGLTREAMAGRLTGSEGSRLATAHVADAMASIGLSPAGDMGSWFQNYRFPAMVELSKGNRLSLFEDGQERTLTLDRDWRPLAFSASGTLDPGDLVFAGYGIQAPSDGEDPAYDSFVGLDVSGKWVLVFRYLPEDLSPKRRQHLYEYAQLRFKALTARRQGAKGLLVVSGPKAQVKEELVPLKSEAGAGGGSLPVISVSNEIGSALLAAAGKDLKKLQTSLDGGESIPGVALPGLRLEGEIALARQSSADRNVLGRLNAGQGPSDSVVILGAHLDHIGRGTGMDSRAEDTTVGEIHPGADDNASGVAALLEIAQHLAHQKAAGKLTLKHDILFAAWTGEELGRLGSAHFVKSFTAKTGDQGLSPGVLTYVNLDMIGRLDDKLYVQGVGSSSAWRRELERRNAPVGLPLRLQDDSYLPTDTTSFYLQGVPILNLFTGTHSDYNTPRDTADRLNYEGLAQIARFTGLLARGLAMRNEGPDYVAQAKPRTGASRANLRAYLGTIPDYTESDVKGVVLTGVAKGGPAERGGLRAGDIILTVAGTTIDNIYDYTYALNALKVGQPVTMTIDRGGNRLELRVTPGPRE